MRVRGILFDSVRSAGQVFWQWASIISEREIRGSREGPTKEPERVGETWREALKKDGEPVLSNWALSSRAFSEEA